MAIKPNDAKKLAEEFNTTELKSLVNASDDLMRALMEYGDMFKAEQAAQSAAELEAALVVRKQGGVRELARRVRDRVTEDGKTETVAEGQTEPNKSEEPSGA
ncbi:MAG: hypothetical protein K1Y36_23170 [Blastocatellia bacterium]|nr:hypothetical protein [Blastocatellia bacterium]